MPYQEPARASIFRDPRPVGRAEIVVFPRYEGNEEMLLEGDFEKIAVSPDGGRLALRTRQNGEAEIWVYELERRAFRPTVQGGLEEMDPLWTPDGQHITFASVRKGRPPDLYWKRVDGLEEAELLRESAVDLRPLSWTADGKTLAFSKQGDIWLLSTDGEAVPFITTPASESHARFSPNGRWLAYVSNESGQDQVYVTSYPQADVKIQISPDSGTDPVWPGDGRELFYRRGNDIMVVTVGTGAELRVLAATVCDTRSVGLVGCASEIHEEVIDAQEEA